jgi:hypothetical protein
VGQSLRGSVAHVALALSATFRVASSISSIRRSKMSEIERLKREIEKYARDRDWENHAIAVELLIKAVRKEK